MIPSPTTRRNLRASEPDPADARTLPGLTPEHGLRQWQNPADYRRYLRQFARHYADGATGIDLGDPPGASQFARSLKGIAHSLGLLEVAVAARRLELALEATPPTEIGIETATEAQEALQTALAVALYSIARYAPESVVAPPAVGDRSTDWLLAAPDWIHDADPAAGTSCVRRLTRELLVPLED